MTTPSVFFERYVELGDLPHWVLKLKTYSEQEAADIMDQLLSSLEWLHTRKILHKYARLLSFINIELHNDLDRDIRIDTFAIDKKAPESTLLMLDTGTARKFSYVGHFYSKFGDVNSRCLSQS